MLLWGDGEGLGGVGKRADRARPLLLAVPAAQSGWVSPFGAPACDLHRLLSLRRPCLKICVSGSVPHALLSELPLVCLSYPAGRVYFLGTLFAHKVFSHFMTPSATARCDF